jgi:hypothetical protein
MISTSETLKWGKGGTGGGTGLLAIRLRLTIRLLLLMQMLLELMHGRAIEASNHIAML